MFQRDAQRTFVMAACLAFVTPAAIAQTLPAPNQTEVKPVAEPGFLGLIASGQNELGRGLRIMKVDRNSPADMAGLREDDLIISINGRLTSKITDMHLVLMNSTPGTKLSFRIDRNGREKEREVTLGVRPPRKERDFNFGRIEESLPVPRGATPRQPPGEIRRLAPKSVLGVQCVDVTGYDRQRYRLPFRRGAIVTSITVGSPADLMGMPLESVIVAIDGRPTTSPADLSQQIALYAPGSEIEVSYYFRGNLKRTRTVLVSAEDIVRREGSATTDGQPQRLPQAIDEYQQRIESLEREVADLKRRLLKLEAISKPR